MLEQMSRDSFPNAEFPDDDPAVVVEAMSYQDSQASKQAVDFMAASNL